ncbi:MAG: hypothetical protein P8J27_17440 [Mariniblastus sp.]|nr:hypothetical protein [Mariniblastus sp.]
MIRLTTAILLCVCSCLVDQRCEADSADEKPHGKDFSSSRHSHPDAEPINLPERYQQAVKNAMNATEKDVSRNLTSILRNNPNLIWRGSGNRQQVLMTTWTSHQSYYVTSQQPLGVPFQEKYNVWVTAAPELKTFCEKYREGKGGGVLSRRLEQLLGLPPQSGHRFIVELWVKPDDLFRPSADPEIADYEAQLKFPDVRDYVSVSQSYKRWYNRTAETRYKPQNGPVYPWTRLGYTYDWGNQETRIGLSEFVIREGAELTVHSISKTDNYGKPETP